MVEKVCIGAVAGAFGVRGELRVKAFTADPADVAAYGPVETEDGRSFRLRVTGSPKGDFVAVRAAGIEDRNAAEALRGVRLYVPRTVLPAPEEDEFYHADLIGLAVVRQSGESLGTVVAVQDFGAGDLLEIRTEGGGASVLMPFTRETAPEIDLGAGRIVADPPPGLFDEASE